ncbi:hypothetical protein [Knoellia sp. Soil729]|uniref:hypothetical protein n=1 Tax=Knoellia sp. Soil729 TaxID=1736394 RepID=UPI0006F3D3DD|nr:hypothetical protein [Knoellia sp. Soil729]KRE43872.1 hypothetical protein ASG74_03280 [Knoellia sp. Soil729]
MSQHDATSNDAETTPIETLLDEGDATSPTTSSAPAYASPYASPYESAYESQAPHGAHVAPTPVPEFRTGPAPVTSLIGLLGLLTAIAVLVSQATDLDIPWGVVGPVVVVGAGVLLVVLGLAGLRGQRFRG